MKRIIFTLCMSIFSLSFVNARQIPWGYMAPGDSLVLFHDSSDPRFYDQSVVTQTAPSTVVTEAFDPARTNGDKLPVAATPVKGEANALKLQWNSAPGGAWKALIASVKWQTFDLTTMSHLRFWINSPTVLDTTELPVLYLEAVTGIPCLTGKIRLADYVKTGLTANTWTQINIPLTDFWAKDLLFQTKDAIKDLFFSQNGMDNTLHTLYLDEFTFVKTTGINVHETNELNAYYANGEIHFTNYTGHVKVFDLIGRLITEGDALNGSISVYLEKGIYTVSTTMNSTRIELP